MTSRKGIEILPRKPWYTQTAGSRWPAGSGYARDTKQAFATWKLISEPGPLVSTAVTSASKGNTGGGGKVDTTRGAPASTGPTGSIREASSCAAQGATRAKSTESSLRSLKAGLARVSPLPGSQTPSAAEQRRASLGGFGAGAELEAASKLP